LGYKIERKGSVVIKLFTVCVVLGEVIYFALYFNTSHQFICQRVIQLLKYFFVGVMLVFVEVMLLLKITRLNIKIAHFMILISSKILQLISNALFLLKIFSFDKIFMIYGGQLF